MSRLWLASLALIAGCYSPDLSGVKYTCTASDPICPDGTTCVNNVCTLPGEPDPGPMPVAGCSGTGRKVSETVFACSGTFAKGGAAALCSANYAICTKLPDKPTIESCNKIDGGFFVTEVKAWRNRFEGPEQAACENNSMGRDRLLFAGCGNPNVSSNISRPMTACQPATLGVDCTTVSASQWECGPDRAASSWVNKVASDGVLCCAK